MTVTANQVWRNYQIDGVPASGINQPKKAEAREWGTGLETQIATLSATLTASFTIDTTNSIFKFGNNVYPDRQAHTEINPIHTATGTVVVGGSNLIGADTSATVSTIIGYRAGESNVANALLYGCDIMGFRAGGNLVDGEYCTILGIDAGHAMTYGRNAVVIGPHAANDKSNVQDSVIISGGYASGTVATSVIIGNAACDNNQTLGVNKNIKNSVVVGIFAARQMTTTSTGNTVIGNNACSIGNMSGEFNTVIGRSAGSTMTTASLCTFVGDGAGGTDTNSNQNSFGFGATCTASNQVTLGNSSIGALRCQVTSITALSDARDKYDIQDIGLGTDFIMSIKARKYKWDTRDGAKHTAEFSPGVIAQELAEAEDKFDARWMGLTERSNPDRLEATPGNLLFPLINMVQEQQGLIVAMRSEIEALKLRVG
ncbi:tail fiber domain-containing protein [Bradyrhizobium japonicum]|uniref:tail fiber domain-containing protein n=1 Tax=Bradyrhizobium japonicum TaxID=375 RepID=UPI002714A419|nr:tail fiber domain-containing protein [Bradyrhizobium japonicum]WLB14977.1 tail fiber domain-containing protein [Bradyrhizobium japonicum]